MVCWEFIGLFGFWGGFIGLFGFAFHDVFQAKPRKTPIFLVV